MRSNRTLRAVALLALLALAVPLLMAADEADEGVGDARSSLLAVDLQVDELDGLAGLLEGLELGSGVDLGVLEGLTTATTRDGSDASAGITPLRLGDHETERVEANRGETTDSPAVELPLQALGSAVVDPFTVSADADEEHALALIDALTARVGLLDSGLLETTVSDVRSEVTRTASSAGQGLTVDGLELPLGSLLPEALLEQLPLDVLAELGGQLDLLSGDPAGQLEQLLADLQGALADLQGLDLDGLDTTTIEELLALAELIEAIESGDEQLVVDAIETVEDLGTGLYESLDTLLSGSSDDSTSTDDSLGDSLEEISDSLLGVLGAEAAASDDPDAGTSQDGDEADGDSELDAGVAEDADADDGETAEVQAADSGDDATDEADAIDEADATGEATDAAEEEAAASTQDADDAGTAADAPVEAAALTDDLTALLDAAEQELTALTDELLSGLDLDAIGGLDGLLAQLASLEELLGELQALVEQILGVTDDVAATPLLAVDELVVETAASADAEGGAAEVTCRVLGLSVLGESLGDGSCEDGALTGPVTGALDGALGSVGELLSTLPGVSVDGGDLGLQLLPEAVEEVTVADDGTVTALAEAVLLRLDVPSVSIDPSQVLDDLLSADLAAVLSQLTATLELLLADLRLLEPVEGVLTPLEDGLADLLGLLDPLTVVVEDLLAPLSDLLGGLDVLDEVLATPALSLVVDPTSEATFTPVSASSVDVIDDEPEVGSGGEELPRTGGALGLLGVLALAGASGLRRSGR